MKSITHLDVLVVYSADHALSASVADAISAKVVELSIETHGKPPVDFAFMVMGSEGRQEQTLKTDQDNAIIFEDSQGRADVKDYFISLGKTISKNLNAIGYNLCEGEIMASNPKWCNSLSDWQNQFSIWIASPDAQHVLDSNIFFDFRCVYGNGQLTEALRNHINVLLQHNDLFFFHLANSIIKYKPDLVEEFYDLKKIILPLIGYLRFYALRHQINQTNSMERLTLLSEKQVINEQNSINLRQTYNFLMQLRLTNQSQALLDQENAENTIHQNQLSNLEKICLKKAMDDLTSLQTHLSLEFK